MEKIEIFSEILETTVAVSTETPQDDVVVGWIATGWSIN